MAVIDPAINPSSPNNNVTSIIPVGGRNTSILGIAVDDKTDNIYVPYYANNSSASNVAVIDGSSLRVVATVPVGETPYAAAVDPGANYIYTANHSAATSSIIDGSTNQVINDVPAGSNPIDIATDPTTHMVYVIDQTGAVTAIDGRSGSVSGRFLIGGNLGAGAVDPKLRELYVLSDKGVSVVNERTGKVITVIRAGGDPSDVAVDASSHTLFVTDLDDGGITVIDARSRRVISRLRIPSQPVSIAVDPVAHAAYAVSANTNTISIITWK